MARYKFKSSGFSKATNLTAPPPDMRFGARKVAKKTKAKAKMHKTMKEFKEETLHSGSKTGPKVTSRKQAIAIGLSQVKKAMGKKDVGY